MAGRRDLHWQRIGYWVMFAHILGYSQLRPWRRCFHYMR